MIQACSQVKSSLATTDTKEISSEHANMPMQNIERRMKEGQGARKLGTTFQATSLSKHAYHNDSFEVVEMEPPDESIPMPALLKRAERKTEMTLDFLLAQVASQSCHLLDSRFADILSPAERELKESLLKYLESVSDRAKTAPAWHDVESLFDRLGFDQSKLSAKL